MEKVNLRHPYFYILVRSWNAFSFFDKCIDSILSQTYQNYKILYIDDASDYSSENKSYIKKKLKGHVVKFNKERMFSVYNAYYMLKNFTEKNSVITVVDGDDWLINNNALKIIASKYKNRDIYLTYGNSKVWDGTKYSLLEDHPKYNMLNKEYHSEVIKKASYRKELFRVFHPASFTKTIFEKIKEDSFKENPKLWLRYCFDLATYIPILEMANGKFLRLKENLASYNIASSNTNNKRNLFEFLREDLIIRRKEKYEAIF